MPLELDYNTRNKEIHVRKGSWLKIVASALQPSRATPDEVSAEMRWSATLKNNACFFLFIWCYRSGKLELHFSLERLPARLTHSYLFSVHLQHSIRIKSRASWEIAQNLLYIPKFDHRKFIYAICRWAAQQVRTSSPLGYKPEIINLGTGYPSSVF